MRRFLVVTAALAALVPVAGCGSGDGETYTGLEDFRAGNDVLSHDDTVLTLRNITSVPGEGEFVVVSGHTAPVWPWWAAGGSAVLVVAGAVRFVVTAGGPPTTRS